MAMAGDGIAGQDRHACLIPKNSIKIIWLIYDFRGLTLVNTEVFPSFYIQGCKSRNQVLM